MDQTPLQKVKKKIPLYQLLVSQGMTENEARAFILAGKVIVENQRVDKPFFLVSSDVALRVKGFHKFMSRAGEKLDHAIKELSLQDTFKDRLVLDVGASTGGFTDCVLRYGAEKVVALDVGFNQLAWKLKQDPRVLSLEQTDIRVMPDLDMPAFDWVVADISFNSIAKLAKGIVGAHTKPSTKFLILVKPQFELNPWAVEEGGVIRSEKLQMEAVEHAVTALQEEGLKLLAKVQAKPKGKKGNQEYFLYLEFKEV